MSPTLPQRPLRVQSDARLLQLARRGETAAFEALVRRHRRQLHGYSRRLGLGDAQAEDALQQGLLHAWRALRRGDDVRDVKSWMYRVVHNAALDALRRSGGDSVELDEGVHCGAEVSAAGELDRRLTVHATLTELAALPRMQREALVRTAVHGDSHEQVASALGLSHAAVRGLVHRARIAMRAAAGALVPERLLQWAVRWASGTGAAGAPEIGTGGAGGGGVLAALAKGGAILATGGVLAGGLAAVQHGHLGGDRHTGRHGEGALAVSLSSASKTKGTAGSVAAGDGVLLASLAEPKDANAGHGRHSVSAASRDTPADNRPSIGQPTGGAPAAALRLKPASAGGSPVQLAPGSFSPHDRARPRAGAPGTRSTMLSPSAPPDGQGAQTTPGNRQGRAPGGNVAGGAADGSAPGRSSRGDHPSGGAQHEGGGRESKGNSSTAHVADNAGGGDDAGGAGETPAYSGSSGSYGSGGEGEGEPGKGMQSAAVNGGNGQQSQAPVKGGSSSGVSQEDAAGGSSQQDS